MPFELPHTRGCVVCGHDNPHGIHLHLNVDELTGLITAEYVPPVHHMGFQGIVHGGVLSTILDEAMVWAASWHGKRFCVCGELNVRFRHGVLIGQSIHVEARIASVRSRLIETEGFLRDAAGKVLVESVGKYVPVSQERSRDVVATFVPQPATDPARQRFSEGV